MIVGPGIGMEPKVRIFDPFGQLLYPEFIAYSAFGKPGIRVRATDVDFDGRDDIVGMSVEAF